MAAVTSASVAVAPSPSTSWWRCGAVTVKGLPAALDVGAADVQRQAMGRGGGEVVDGLADGGALGRPRAGS